MATYFVIGLELLVGLLVTVFLLVEGWARLVKGGRLVRVGVRLDGRVQKTGRHDDGHPWSMISYMVGSKVFMLQASDRERQVGEVVSLKVNPDRPLDCEIARFGELIFVPVMMLFVGLMSLAIVAMGTIELVRG